jgi:hypothetical protein
VSQLPVVNSEKDKDELNTCKQADSEKQILSKPEFFETIGKNLRKYWKIGIHSTCCGRSAQSRHSQTSSNLYS